MSALGEPAVGPVPSWSSRQERWPPNASNLRAFLAMPGAPSSFLLLVAMPFAPSSFLLLVGPGAPSSFLPPSSVSFLKIGLSTKLLLSFTLVGLMRLATCLRGRTVWAAVNGVLFEDRSVQFNPCSRMTEQKQKHPSQDAPVFWYSRCSCNIESTFDISQLRIYSLCTRLVSLADHLIVIPLQPKILAVKKHVLVGKPLNSGLVSHSYAAW